MGKKHGMCVPSSAHRTLVPNAIASSACGAHTMVDVLFAWLLLIVLAEMGSLGSHICGFTILPMESLLRPSGTNSCPPQKAAQGRTKADTSVPTTNGTTRSGRLKKPPPPKDGVYLSEGDSTLEERYTRNDPTPRPRLEGTGLQAWMDVRHICAYQEVVRCMGEVLEPRA